MFPFHKHILRRFAAACRAVGEWRKNNDEEKLKKKVAGEFISIRIFWSFETGGS